VLLLIYVCLVCNILSFCLVVWWQSTCPQVNSLGFRLGLELGQWLEIGLGLGLGPDLGYPWGEIDCTLL